LTRRRIAFASSATTVRTYASTPNTGAIVADTALTFAAGESEAGMTPDVTAADYSNNFQGATITTLFAIDWRRGTLQRIGSPNGSPVSPNSGQVFTVGTLGTGFQITEMVGSDIAPNAGTAYAALRSADSLNGSSLHIESFDGRGNAASSDRRRQIYP